MNAKTVLKPTVVILLLTSSSPARSRRPPELRCSGTTLNTVIIQNGRQQIFAILDRRRYRTGPTDVHTREREKRVLVSAGRHFSSIVLPKCARQKNK